MFAPVTQMDTVQMILAFAAQRGWTIYQLDVKSTFLHGELTEDVFVEQSRGHEVMNEAHKVSSIRRCMDLK